MMQSWLVVVELFCSKCLAMDENGLKNMNSSKWQSFLSAHHHHTSCPRHSLERYLESTGEALEAGAGLREATLSKNPGHRLDTDYIPRNTESLYLCHGRQNILNQPSWINLAPYNPVSFSLSP